MHLIGLHWNETADCLIQPEYSTIVQIKAGRIFVEKDKIDHFFWQNCDRGDAFAIKYQLRRFYQELWYISYPFQLTLSNGENQTRSSICRL